MFEDGINTGALDENDSHQFTIKNILYGNLTLILVSIITLGWIIESLLHTYVVKEKSFAENLIPSDTNELWMRGVIILISILFFLYIKTSFLKLQKASKAISESEQHFRSLFEVASDGIIYFSIKTKEIKINESFAKLHGYTLPELWEINIQDLEAEKQLELAYERKQKIINGEKVRYEIKHYHKSGQVIDLEVTSSIMHLEKESFIVSFYRDVTEQNVIKNELIRRTRDLSSILKSSQVLSSTLVMETVLQSTTDSIIELTDLQSSAIYLLEGDMLFLGATSPPLPLNFPIEFRNSPLTDHLHIQKAITTHEPVFIPNIETAELTLAERAIAEQRNLKSILYIPLIAEANVIGVLIVAEVGKPRILSSSEIDMCRTLASFSALSVENAKLYRLAQKEIEERKLIETELINHRLHLEDIIKIRTEELRKQIEKQKEYEMLLSVSLGKEKQLNEMKSSFISTTSHEFRTPLTSILSSTQLLDRSGNKLSDEKKNEHFQRIYNSVNYLTKLLDDMLTLSKVENGIIKFNPVLVDFYSFSENCFNDAKSLASEVHELIFTYKTIQKEFQLDLKLMRFILNNLLSNAIKYSPEGGEVELKIDTQEENLLIDVIDFGIGVPQEDIQKVFDSFYRTKNASVIAGNGLGLAIVKQAVELHSGDITVTSELNKGTTFTVKIPVKVSLVD